MKFYETHFEEYLHATENINLHPKLEKLYNKFPKNIDDFKNLIFYGPSGVGKYTQMLRSIKKYSQSELKYEKKICITFNKMNYFLKISDIHYEVDMSLLGCNSKLLWHDIYQQIVDIISSKTNKNGIIVCKCFHEIHSELLDNFYSYMQNNFTQINIIFILLTEQISFIPENILGKCEIIHCKRPTKSQYIKCIPKNISTSQFANVSVENITNIKNIGYFDENLMAPHKIICNKVIDNITHISDVKFLNFRDILYDFFIYNIDINNSIWYILTEILKKNKIQKEDLSKILLKTYVFLQYYNNNYRPIYHFENYLLYLAKIIHGFA